MLGEWLPIVWGDEPPEFESEEQAWGILGHIMGRNNEIIHCLAEAPEELSPIFLQTADPTISPEVRPQRSLPLRQRQRQKVQEVLLAIAEKIRVSEFKICSRIFDAQGPGGVPPSALVNTDQSSSS